MFLSGARVHPLQAAESLADDRVGMERQTLRPRPTRGLVIAGGVAVAGVLGWAVWPWSDTDCGEVTCVNMSDMVGAVLLGGAIGAGLFGLIAAPFAQVLGWDALDPAILPQVVPTGGDGGLTLTWRSFPGSEP